MKKILLLITVLFIPLLISSCANRQNPPSQPALEAVIQEERLDKTLNAFTALNISGPFEVKLKQSNRHQVTLTGPSHLINQIQLEEINEVLLLSLPYEALSGQIAVIRAEISAPHIHEVLLDGTQGFTAEKFDSEVIALKLNNFNYANFSGQLGVRALEITGEGRLTLQGISSQTLNIAASGNSHLELRGMANIGTLTFSDNATVDMYWLDSPQLIIRGSGQAVARLAGIVGVMHADLTQNAYLDARALRTKEAYVKAFDHSNAEITVLDIQNVLASNSSTVYFHKNSGLMNNFMAYEGSVLDVDGLWAEDPAYHY